MLCAPISVKLEVLWGRGSTSPILAEKLLKDLQNDSHGTLACSCDRLVSGAGDIKLTKDGNVLLHEMVSSTTLK